MRIMAFGCIHIQTAVTLGSSAFNSTCSWLMQLAKEARPNAIVYLGDTVESVSSQDLAANMQVKALLDQFKALAAAGTKVYWMIGNHDIYSEALNALSIFEDAPNFQIVRQPVRFADGNNQIVLWPYEQWMDKPDECKPVDVHPNRGGSSVLLCHMPIEGMPLGGSKDRGADLKELGLVYTTVIAGHYHIANAFAVDALSAVCQVLVPGCVMAHDFADSGLFHGAIIYDTPSDAAPTGSAYWVSNPYSHFFLKGSKQEIDQIVNDPKYKEILGRLHVRIDGAYEKVGTDTLSEYRQKGLPTVQLRMPKEQIASSGKPVFALTSDPIADITSWFGGSGKTLTPELLQLARKYLA